ncbi:MAG: hypothetical protein H7282_08025 [Cytophagaceae bacterium]|nr:hypothetical protein [Cytophagaceae bacterium]
MKRNDYIKLLSGGLLQVSESKFRELATFIEQRFEVHELRKPQTVSIGGQASDNQYLGLIEWAKAFRKENIESVTYFYSALSEKQLPAHMAAAFAGVEDVIFHVKTAAQNYFCILQTRYSPSNEISPEQLLALVNAQVNPASEWTRLEELVQKNNELNSRPRMAEGSIQSHLVSPEGYQTFEWQAGDFVKELQLNAIIKGTEFVIPEALKDLLQPSSFSFYDDKEEREYIYLYLVEEISSKELISLVETQPFADEVIHKLDAFLKEYPNGLTLDPFHWKESIQNYPADQLQGIANMMCRFICECCEEKKMKPFIPASLKSKLGPDELEAQRIVARGKLDRSQYFLAGNTQPWEAHTFERMDYTGVPEVSPPEEELKATLQQALKATGAFAAKNNSNFAEAFQFADYLLTGLLPEGNFDEAHKEKIIRELKELNFSDRAIENFTNVFFYSEELLIIGWDSKTIYAFFACSIADVFGGMGSWNDQYFEPEEENVKYQQLSGALFNALKKYFVALLSFQK